MSNFMKISRNLLGFSRVSVVYWPKVKSKIKFLSILMFSDVSKIAIFFEFFLEGNQGQPAKVRSQTYGHLENF